MRITSTLQPTLLSENNFVVLHRGSERVLVPMHETAKEHHRLLLEALADVWNIGEEDVVFETDELNVCPGQRTKLSKTCFTAGILAVIGNVYIKTRESKVSPRRAMLDISANHESRYHKSTSGDNAKTLHMKGSAKEREQTDFVVVTSSPDTDNQNDKASEDKTDERMEATGDIETERAISHSDERPRVSAPAPRFVHHNISIQHDISSSPTKFKPGPDNGMLQSSQQVHPQQAQQRSGEERIVVCIHDGDVDNSAAFRVSPDQTILRVLKGACKHFSLNFSKTSLRMVSSSEIDGETQTIAVKCNPQDTVKSLGVREYQEFMVVPSEDSS